MQELTEKLRISEAIIKERMSKTGRTCGDCSLCCKLLPSVELNKPANIWCTHCSPSPAGGCSIYEHRQNVCRGFACAYLLANWIGDHWRPTRSHMVIHIKKLANGQLTGVVHVDLIFLTHGSRSRTSAIYVGGQRTLCRQMVQLRYLKSY